MEIKIICSIISIIIGLAAFYPYIRDVIKKTTRPHEFTWLIWSITQGTAVVGMWVGGAGVGALTLTIATICVFSVFLFSLRIGSRNITKSDIAILVLALLAITIWWFLNNPVAAIILVSAIDVSGFIPTFRKSYKHPRAETLSTWIAFLVSNLFALLAIENYNLLSATYLASISFMEILLILFLIWRRKAVKN